MRGRVAGQTGWLCVVGSVLALLLGVGPVRGDESLSAEESVQAARDALAGFNGYPWYDSERDDIRRLDVSPPADVAARKSKWVYQPVNWSFPDWFPYLFEGLGWLILAVAILIVIYALLRALGWADFSGFGKRKGEEQDPLHGDIDQVEALPFPLQRPKSDLLAEARRHYEAGDYDLAMIYLYSYQLIQLDRHHVIRLTKGKTNRQYLREVRPRPELWELMRGSMVAFEDVYFGRHPLERSRFDRCWNQLVHFHRELEALAV